MLHFRDVVPRVGLGVERVGTSSAESLRDRVTLADLVGPITASAARRR